MKTDSGIHIHVETLANFGKRVAKVLYHTTKWTTESIIAGKKAVYYKENPDCNSFSPFLEQVIIVDMDSRYVKNSFDTNALPGYEIISMNTWTMLFMGTASDCATELERQRAVPL